MGDPKSTGMTRSPSIRRLLRAGTDASRGSKLRSSLETIGSVRFLAVALFRTSHAAGARHPVLGSAVKQLNHLLTGADLAWQAAIDPGMVLYHPTGVVIGPFCQAGSSVRIQQGVTLGGKGGVGGGGVGQSPTVGDRVEFGAGSPVIGPINVGSRARIGANAVVTSNVDAGDTVVGVPARPVLRDVSDGEVNSCTER